MRKIITLNSVIVFFLAFFAASLWSAEFIPLINIDLLGGQYYFQGERSSFGGNASLNLVGAIKFDQRWSVIPSYYGSYRKTKEVTELVGGGTLSQQAQTHLLSLKTVYQLNPDLKLKLKAGNGWELLRETLDEQWGEGLFNYRKTSTGLEVEKSLPTKEISLLGGYDYYAFTFPNYQSLADQYGAELIGKNVLNFYSHQLYGQSSWLVTPKFYTQAGYTINQKNFLDQKIVTDTAEYLADKRKDQQQLISLQLSYLFPFSDKKKLTLGAIFDGQIYSSNQNHYDARAYRFIPRYYDYQELGVNPLLNYYWGKASLFFQYRYSRRNYRERLVQNASGAYQSEKTVMTTNLFSGGINYLLTKRFTLKCLISKLFSHSNMQYEASYKYNYNTANYFLGISYEY